MVMVMKKSKLSKNKLQEIGQSRDWISYFVVPNLWSYHSLRSTENIVSSMAPLIRS
jgi:hypothetical protein